MKLTALIHEAEEGGYWCEVPSLPGCYSEGDTFDEAVMNIREAAAGWLEVAAARNGEQRQEKVVEVDL